MIKTIVVTVIAAAALECVFLKALSSGVGELEWQMLGDDYD